MRKIFKKACALALVCAMTIQPISGDFLNLSPKIVEAAPVTNTVTVPAAQSRVEAAKNNTEWQVGAKMPYFRYDTSPAEVPNSYTNNATNLAAMDEGTVSYQDNYTGTKKVSTNFDRDNIASQASNQSYVELGKGQSITWKIKTGHGGDGVNVRYTLPDGNGGTDNAGKPLGLQSQFSVSTSNNASVLGYDNEDSSRRYNTYLSSSSVKVTSDYAWQYFPSGHPVDANNADGAPGFAFDEVHFRLSQVLTGESTITITNTGNYTLGIDFIEVEYTDYISAPSGAVVVPAGTHTQSQLEGYILKAEAGSKIVYFASGVHYLDSTWILAANGVKFTGAGMWYTKLQFTGSDMGSGGICGERTGYCQNVEFCNMYINSNLHSRFKQQANYKCFRDLFAKGTSIHDIWEEHFECGFWVGRYDSNSINKQSDLSIFNCRVRNNFADGVNFCQGTRDSNVHNCDIRNNGDDGLAMWNDTEFQQDDEYNNIFCYNTVEFIWRAGGIAVYGGDGHKVYNNYVRDMYLAAGIHVTDGFPGPKFQNTKKIEIKNNVVVRAGTYSDSWKEPLAAIDVKGGVQNVEFNNNEVYDSQNNAIRTWDVNSSTVSFNNTVVFGVGLDQHNDSYFCNAHSATAVRQSSANVKFNNFIAKNVVTKYLSESADKHWPYYCDVATNLPTIPTSESQFGNTNYKFTIDSNGNYAYSGGTYVANSNANSFPGYDMTNGQKILKEGTEPETTKVPEPETTKKPEPETTKEQEVSGYDLTVEGLAWANDQGSTELKEGDNVTFSVLVVNNSSIDIPAGTVIGFKAVVDGNATVSNQTFKNGLRAGETVKLSATTKWTATYGGHTVVATVDDTNKLPNESNENNNTRTKLFNVAGEEKTYAKVSGGYDLVVTKLEWDKSSIGAGDKILFTATVTNIGDTDAPAGAQLGVCVYMDGNEDVLVWDDTHKTGLEAGESVKLTMTGGSNDNIYWTASAGIHTATAWVNDQTSRYPNEVNYNNNKTDFKVTVPSRALVENPDESDDLDNIVPDDSTKIHISNSVKIEGYQISTALGGSRVVGSVEPTINNKRVVNWGFVYAVTKAGDETFDVKDTDMFVGTTNKYAVALESTPIGTAENVKPGTSDTATCFVRTTLFGANSVKEYTAQYKVRAYALLSDGSYVYSDICSYSVYEIASTLYDKRMMSTYSGHNYLYDSILKVVNSSYIKVDYNWSDTVVGFEN